MRYLKRKVTLRKIKELEQKIEVFQRYLTQLRAKLNAVAQEEDDGTKH